MDKERAKAFMSTMVDTLNSGSLALMMSIGHRTGLFDQMAGMGYVSSVDLAATASLDERHVREWLAAMASGGIVDYDPASERFELPVEHQRLVTREGGPLNLASKMQTIALLGSVEDDVVESFETGSGVPYSRYPRFQSWMAEESAARFDAALLDVIIPSIPDAVDALTAGATFGDIGCGSGHAVLLLAEAFPNSTFVGIDFSDDGLEAARLSAEAIGVNNVEFIGIDAAALDIDQRFDFVTTFDAIHDQAQPDAVLSNIHRSLKPGGRYLCVEPTAHSALSDNMTEPVAAYQYTMSTMHCMAVSIAGGGEGLGTAWGADRIHAALDRAGFENLETVEVKPDRTNSYVICEKR